MTPEAEALRRRIATYSRMLAEGVSGDVAPILLRQLADARSALETLQRPGSEQRRE